jgi:signal-transduction protein with cAMP-binding, CBS, and nucleotidyltransferase domain
MVDSYFEKESLIISDLDVCNSLIFIVQGHVDLVDSDSDRVIETLK